MLQILQLLSPAFNKIVWEYQKLRNVQLIENEPQENNSGYKLTFSTPSLTDPSKIYKQIVFFETLDQLTTHSKCLVRCDCPDFIYHYQTRLFFNKGLYGDPDSKKLPKKIKFGVCKHLNVVLNEILKRFKNELIAKPEK